MAAQKGFGSRNVIAPHPAAWTYFDAQKDFVPIPIMDAPPVEPNIESLHLSSPLLQQAPVADRAPEPPRVFFAGFLGAGLGAQRSSNNTRPDPLLQATPIFTPLEPSPSALPTPGANPFSSIFLARPSASAGGDFFAAPAPEVAITALCTPAQQPTSSASPRPAPASVAKELYRAQFRKSKPADFALLEYDNEDEDDGDLPIVLSVPEVETDPARNPSIPLPNTSPFSSLQADLLRTVLERYFTMFDLLILRLTCKRWLEAIRGMRISLDLLTEEYTLSSPVQLANLVRTFPKARGLKISFALRTQASRSLSKPRKRYVREQPKILARDTDIAALFTFPDLIDLHININEQPQVTPNAIHFSRLLQLKTLRFGYVSPSGPDVVPTQYTSTANDLVACIGQATALTSLMLRVPVLTSTALQSLSALQSLTQLDLSWAPRLDSLAPLTKLTALEMLVLHGCNGIPEEDLKATLLALPRLRSVTVPRDDQLLDAYTELRKGSPLFTLIIGD